MQQRQRLIRKRRKKWERKSICERRFTHWFTCTSLQKP